MTTRRTRPNDYFDYGPDQQAEISFPLGGIGTGSIGLSGSGRLIDWEIRNRPDKGSVNGFTHFAIRAERDGQTLDTRILHGPFDGRLAGDIQAGPFRSFGFGVRREYLAGLPNFEDCSFRGFYPVAELDLSDSLFPGDVRLTALNPFTPGDAENSSIPAAMFEYEITNTDEQAIDYTLVGCLAATEGLISTSSVETRAGGETSLRFSPHEQAGDVAAGFATADRGQLSITALDGDISFQHYWYRGNFFDALHVYWEDVIRPGPLQDRVYPESETLSRQVSGQQQDHGLVASRVTLGPGETRRLRFFIAWHFPVFAKYWPSAINLVDIDEGVARDWQNWYAVRWPAIDDVEAYCVANWGSLWDRTLGFRDVLSRSDLPTPVLDAVSANLSVLKTATVSRLPDGTLYGFEGCHVDAGSCEGSCTHVWNYQQAVPFLFPDLARSMLDKEFGYNQDPDTGGLGFRLPLPLGIGRNDDRPCVDGHYGAVMRTYREWRLSGDDEWLRSKWPMVEKAIGYAWHPGNYDRWDPERTGVIWGRQHHTLDMELFGPNSWLTGFYLGALRAGSRMAKRLGKADVAQEYDELFERGRAWVDANLYFDGYYAQSIDLTDRTIIDEFAREQDNHPVVEGTIADLYWSDEHGEIKYQIGTGCEIDQTLAQWHATLHGLGDLFDPDQHRSSVKAVFEHNFKEDLGKVANPCRVFGVAGEAGTLIATWPDRSSAPAIPIPYAQETQHGYEYAFGGSLLQIGELERGVRVFQAIRDRYRGGNRNPWNEIECGSNYARSMASFAAVPILSGFEADLSEGRLSFAPRLQNSGGYRSLWSVNGAWGEVRYAGDTVALEVLGGELALDTLSIGYDVSPRARVEMDGNEVGYSLMGDPAAIRLAPLAIGAGSALIISGVDLDLSQLPDVAAVTRAASTIGASTGSATIAS